ncbi:MAG TPA: cystathionine beta-lyase [Dongiaceae bacterium]|jgi:cystathionine beta-lyase|nr:cystathionine beta-lyase [Dongiaceae bacterium]
MASRDSRDRTAAIHGGCDPAANFGIPNPPVYRASTILFPSLAALEASDADRFAGVHYGLYGTPTTFAFEKAVAELEGADHAVAVPSGLAAITMALLAFTKPGDHVLIVDSCYGPTRTFCDAQLARFGIEIGYYDPLIGEGIAALFRPNTRLVFLENPGSNSFEIQDVPAIAAACQARGIITILDNTWATPLFFKPFAHGVDVSLHAVTKYIGGHADLMLGIITTRAEHYRRLKNQVHGMGMSVSPEDCALALRGLRSMPARLAEHQQNSIALAHWLEQRPEVRRVLHPALPSHPGHDLWRRDFTGATGLFAIELHPTDKTAIAAMVSGMRWFGLGYSWGGVESLILPVHETSRRVVRRDWCAGPVLRLHAGLEDVEDLKEDLAAGFARLTEAQTP